MKIHLAYVRMFMEDLEINRTYFPYTFEAKMLAFYDIKRVLKQAVVRIERPKKLHRVRRKSTSLEEQIPVQFIEELVQSSLFADCQGLIQENPVKNEVLQVRDSSTALICCHCIRRAEELKNYRLLTLKKLLHHASFMQILLTDFKPASLAIRCSTISSDIRRKLVLF